MGNLRYLLIAHVLRKSAWFSAARLEPCCTGARRWHPCGAQQQQQRASAEKAVAATHHSRTRATLSCSTLVPACAPATACVMQNTSDSCVAMPLDSSCFAAWMPAHVCMNALAACSSAVHGRDGGCSSKNRSAAQRAPKFAQATQPALTAGRRKISLSSTTPFSLYIATRD